jgi:hypothetical protein
VRRRTDDFLGWFFDWRLPELLRRLLDTPRPNLD